KNGQLSCAFARKTLVFERCNGVDAAQAPIDGLTIMPGVSQEGDGKPTRDVEQGDQPGAAEINRTGNGDDESRDNHGNVWGGRETVHAVESIQRQQGKSVDGEIEQADPNRERVLSG